MLTGDKVETAINIGVSAGLLDHDMLQCLVEETEEELVSAALEDIAEQVK